MRSIFLSISLILVLSHPVLTQTTSFTYQGKLTDGVAAASGLYEMRFRVYDAVTGGNQLPVGAPVTIDFTVTGGNAVSVNNGVFTVSLDFGPNIFTGADRWLEIGVKKPAEPSFTTLNPRQPISSSPYTLKSLSANNADALNANCVLCVTDAQILSLDGSKITGTVANAVTSTNVSGIVPITNGGTGSSSQNFVDLSTNQTVSGNKTFTGAIGVTGGGGVFNGNGSGLTNLNGANIAGGTVTSSQLSPEAVPNSATFKLLGSLRWDLLKPQASFPTGVESFGAAFDGTNVWVTNRSSNNVMKLRPSDGANLGTFTVTGGPTGIAFDGANLWIVRQFTNNVTKLRASDGANLGTFPVGTTPFAVAFDGANVWVVNSTTNNVTKLRASDGANLGTFPVGTSPFEIAFDGVNIWVTNYTGNNVTKLRASDGASLGTFPVGTNPVGIAFDGVNIWIANEAVDNVTKLRASDGANLGTFPVGDAPQGIAFDGANIWVANFVSNNVTKLRANDGTNLGTFPAGGNPFAVTFDGANIWVANTAGATVTRMMPAFPQ